MTEAQFLAIHLQQNGNNINTANNINVNYDVVSGTGYITGFTVTTLADPIRSEVVDVSTILERATKVSFNLNGVLYDLPIQSREQYFLPLPGNSFYYFRVNPSVTFSIASLPSGIDTVPVTGIVTSITPFISNFEFEYGDYNAVFGNSTLIRRSKKIMQSDRLKSTTTPTNFAAIASGSATLAEVQDSNYTNTGWTHARYIGSKTSTSTYGGISPAATGRSFEGEVYRAGAPSNNICSQSLANRVLNTLFFTGNTEFPEYSEASSSLSVSTTIDLAETRIPVTITSPTSASVDTGTIIRIGSELMRVVSTDYLDSSIYVERGYLSTSSSLVSTSGEPIIRIAPVQIFSIDNNATNKTNTVYTSKIWVKETEEVIYTDSYGMVYSSGSCLV
jgi:hypothetical protein